MREFGKRECYGKLDDSGKKRGLEVNQDKLSAW